MELLTILLADYANITREGKLNVMGIFQTIYAKNFPAKHLSMTLVLKLGADLGEYSEERHLTIKIMDADGKEIMRFEKPIIIPGPSGGQRPEVNAIIQINEIVFPQPGRYQIGVFVDKDAKGSLPIDVEKVQTHDLNKKLD